jgi:hypothetical protein
MYAIFVVSSIALIVIIYKDNESPWALKFVIGYIIFLLLFCLYVIAVAVMNMKKMKWIDIRKRLVNFLLWFIALAAFIYINNFILNRPSKGVYGDLAIPLGLSFGIAFFDLLFLGSRDN